MAQAPVPQSDPKAGYLAQRGDIDAAVARVLAGGWYILGEDVAAFEREFAAYIGAAHGVGVASGTDALVLALRAIGVAGDDYVATVSHTAVATVAAIELAGAKPLLIDIDPATYTLDAAALARVLAAPPGRVAAFSFYPTKNLGAFGDGGMVVTSDDGLAGRLKALREYGWRERYVSDLAGMNSRLDE